MPNRSAGLRDDAERRNDELPELAEVANFAQLRLAAAVHSPENIIEISPVCPGSYAFAFKKIKINARINSELALGNWVRVPVSTQLFSASASGTLS